MKLKDLVKVLDNTYDITICYATNGKRLFKGSIKDIPENLLNYFITLILPAYVKYYVEVHESSSFMEE